MKNGTYSITIEVNNGKVTSVQATDSQKQKIDIYKISILLESAGICIGQSIEKQSTLHLLPPQP